MTTQKILFLGPENSPLLTWLKESGENVIQTSDALTGKFLEQGDFSFLISYGYLHILEKHILDQFPDAAINLHVSYLPWNRGKDPNFWSFVETTPKGVTIHYIDEGVDTGDIIVQQKVTFDSAQDTLASSYQKLQCTIQELFKQHWRQIVNGRCQRQKQVGKGTVHKEKEKEPLIYLLTDGWNTPVSVLEAYAVKRDSAGTARNGSLYPITDTDLKDLLRWRNHPRVREVMITKHHISWEEHLVWWEKTRSDETQQWYIYQENNEPTSVIYFIRLNAKEKTGWWGFYLCDYSASNSAKRLFVWHRVEQVAIRYAFEKIGLRLLLCEMIKSNRAVIYLHEKHGFRESNIPPSTMDVDLQVMELKNPDFEPKSRPDRKENPAKTVVAFLGSANWELAIRDFDNQARDYCLSPASGKGVEILPVPFGQYPILLSDETSTLRRNKIDYWIFCERFEDFFDAHAVFDEKQIATANDRFRQYLSLLHQARRKVSGNFLVLDMWPMTPAVETVMDTPYAGQGRYGLASDWNRQLLETVHQMPDAEWVDFSSVVQQIGANSADPGKYWPLARMACSSECATALNRRLLGWMLKRTGATSRLLVLDADNTLWGGLAGENGPGGVQISGDYPGNQYRAIQSVLAALRRQGHALALCSKNDQESVLNVFRQRKKDLLLAEDDFSAMRVNWRPKPENIREIAEDLNLSLHSVCFIDDSPYEREEVRQILPEVTVPEMPEDICQWSRFLTTLPNLFAGRLTEEDKNRAQQYKARAQIMEQQSHFASHEDFLASLKMELHFEHYGESNCQRTLQLLAKTNQFNTTTRRYGQKDLERITSEGGEVFALHLSDKFGSDEIIGNVIILYEGDTATIDSLLLSCRVLGRSIETAVLAWCAERAHQRNARHLHGIVLPTKRNHPVRGIFKDHGFQQIEDSTFLFDLASANIAVPEWFTLRR